MANAQDQRDQVLVMNTKTRQKRMMGSIQFNTWGKNNGWKLVPSTEDAPSEELQTNGPGTDNESGGSDEGSSGSGEGLKTSDDYNANDAIVEIKKMGEAGDIEGINAFIAGEEENKNRSSVLNAAAKYLEA